MCVPTYADKANGVTVTVRKPMKPSLKNLDFFNPNIFIVCICYDSMYALIYLSKVIVN